MDSDEGKLFIGGIPWETTEERLKEHFSSYGEVAEVVIMKDRATGRARGFGFVVFSDPVVADQALLDKHTIDGKTVEAKKAMPRNEQQNMPRRNFDGPGPAGYVRTKKIFVGGLASTVTEDDFRKYFEQFGNITDVVVMYDHATQRPRGFGFISFDSEDAVDNVLQKPFHELNEKLVEVKRAVPKDQQGLGMGRSAGGAFPPAGRGSGYGYGYGQGGYGPVPAGNYNPAGRGGYPAYGAGGYGNASYGGGYGPSVNGTYGAGGYGGTAGYGGAAGGYGSGNFGSAPPTGVEYAAAGAGGGYGSGGAASGGYAASSGGRSNWDSGTSGYGSGGNPASYGTTGGGNPSGYGASAGWGSGGPGATQPAASGGYGYGAADGGYGSQTAGNAGRSSGYASNTGGYNVPSGTTSAGGYGGGYNNDGYGNTGYSDNAWKSAGNDSYNSVPMGSAPAAGGYPTAVASSDTAMNTSAGYGGGYGATGRQTQRGPDNRFRPYPATGAP
ncbi:hypothetical protein O6H91_19G000400 [Diphasiastrum complanatum]|uniref:Uncharacterized protein n=1 Tax=Diphasiastrum complanatum TaxID=34168 RepID=A0ACC2AS16_DIPCM|nr:hypothetical protein O6H91_19G000400 [Diphasiastrum complanatum]